MQFNRQRVLSEVKALLFRMKELEQYLEGEDSEVDNTPPPPKDYESIDLSGKYNLQSIRLLLTGGFNEAELRNFVLYTPTFRELAPAVADSQGKSVIIGQIISFASQKLLIGTILGWAKSSNPARYALYTYTY